MARIIQKRLVSPFLMFDWFFNLSATKADQDKALKTLHSFTRTIIDERFAENKSAINRKKMAFLDILMNAQTEDGKSLSKDAIQEEVSLITYFYIVLKSTPVNPDIDTEFNRRKINGFT